MKMLRCPLDGFHLQRGRGQTFCNPGREMNRGPVQSPSVAWSFQQNPKAQLAFSSWFHVDLIFLPVSTTLMELGVFELQSGAETPKGLSGGKSKSCFSAPLGRHSHALRDLASFRNTSASCSRHFSLRHPPPPFLRVNIWLCSDLLARWAKEPSQVFGFGGRPPLRRCDSEQPGPNQGNIRL